MTNTYRFSHEITEVPTSPEQSFIAGNKFTLLKTSESIFFKELRCYYGSSFSGMNFCLSYSLSKPGVFVAEPMPKI